MKQLLRLGDCHALRKHRLKHLKIRYISLLAAITTMCLYARAQQQETFAVGGKVISAASGVAIEGATVTNKRTRIHAFTDRLRDYRIPARPDDILPHSFVGYVTAEEEIAGRERITVALDSAENTLEEVEINMGYYTVKDRERTGSVARITAKEIGRQPVSNVLEAMKGRIAGVEIKQHSGDPGSAIAVRIRGMNSISSEVSEPLYIVDGVPFTSTSLQQYDRLLPSGATNPLNTLNPNDIASIDVLKDADATAIYGSRGSNGVVLITTKRGQMGSPSLTLDVRTGVSRVRSFTELLSTTQYLEMRSEAFANSGAVMNANNAYDLMLWDTTRYTDWQREILGRDAANSRAQVSLSGAHDAIRYLISGNFDRYGNVYPGDFGLDRGGVHFNLEKQSGIDGRFGFSLALIYSRDANTMPSYNLAGLALTLPPNAPDLLNADGSLNWDEGRIPDNPLAFTRRPYRSESDNINGAFRVHYNLADGLNLALSLGYNMLRMDEVERIPKSAQNPAASPDNGVSIYDNAVNTLVVEPQINYRKNMGGGSISALLGGTLNRSVQENRWIGLGGFEQEEDLDNLMAASGVRINGYGFTEYRYLGVFARVNYNVEGKYLVNLTARRDGSSRFGPGRKWGNFGAVGLAWVFTGEEFVASAFPWLSFGRLRGSYGITGSDNIGNYQYLSSYIAVQQYQSQPYLLPARIANDDYGWESNRKLEFSLDIGLFRERFSAAITWYDNRSGNQLVGLPLPATTGFETVQFNMPAVVQNSGWELSVNSDNIRTAQFQWTTAVNFTWQNRRLLAYPNIEASPYTNVYQVGKSMYIARTYRYLGIDRETGVYQFADTDGSGNVSDADRVWIERTPPRYGGITNRFQYRGLDGSFSIELDSRSGNPLMAAVTSVPGTIGNMPAGVMDRWKPGDGLDAAVQLFWQGSGTGTTAFNRFRTSSGMMDDIFYARLSNVSIGMNFPSVADRFRMEGVRVYAQGQNLFTVSNFKGADPETAIRSLPLLMTVTLGVQASF